MRASTSDEHPHIWRRVCVFASTLEEMMTWRRPGTLIGWLLLGLPMIASCPARAAGFECDNARWVVEKTICKSPELSQLDSALNIAYKEALAKFPYPHRTRERQRVWLKLRDHCLTIVPLCPDVADLYRDRIEELRQLAGPQAPREVLLEPYTYSVGVDHVGPMKIGMSAARLEFLATRKVVVRQRGRDLSDQCVDVHFSKRDAVPEMPDSAGLFHWSQFGAQLQGGDVVRIDIMSGTHAQTAEGIHPGSTEEELRRAYGSHLKEGPFTYYSANSPHGRDVGRTAGGHSFLLESPDGDLAMFFETDGVQVNGMHVGKASAFKVWSFKGEPSMPEGAIYTQTCEELLALGAEAKGSVAINYSSTRLESQR